jgi:rhodanese-related sulfurtransferase
MPVRKAWAWMRPRQRERVGQLSAPELASLLAQREALQIVDIRDEAAFRAGHLPGAHCVPFQGLEQGLSALDPSRPTVVY